MLIKQRGEAKKQSESSTNNFTNVSSYSYDHEYQTASELFDLMTRQHHINTGNDSLSTRDLVILYENIDIGTKLLSDAKQGKTREPNQLVETVIYNDESESEASDNLSTADIAHLCRTNEETLDLLQPHLSNDISLCRKSSRIELPTLCNQQYDKHFHFKEPFIKNHLQSLRSCSVDFEPQMLPSTLLDFLCCKRLEDNYTFNMDNIIRHVTLTIEQLKRISNGDFLTDKAKEMWREVRNENSNAKNKNYTPKMLATCTSFPLHIERKNTGTPSFWDDIVHSEVDLRSLSRVLEKKIYLEIPKIICGSFKLFTQQCAENLIIRCQQSDFGQNTDKPKESHVDVVLQLKRSESGQVMSNINSIMLVEEISKELQEDIKTGGILALPYKEPSESSEKSTVDLKVIEMSNNEDSISSEEDIQNKYYSSDGKDSNCTSERSENEYMPRITARSYEKDNNDLNYIEDNEDTGYKPRYKNFDNCYKHDQINIGYEENNDSFTEDPASDLKEVIESQSLPTYSVRSSFSNDFHLTMQALAMPDTLPEETEDNMPIPLKKKSSPRVRVKSPYENKSRVTEDKKRKKLLEIKEKRERKRNALNENSKITKHKFSGRSPVTPHSAGSVTKLSISNKSFYNSIYGKNLELENGANSRRHRKKFEPIPDVTPNEENKDNYVKDVIQLQTNINDKFFNSCYGQEDTVENVENLNLEPISTISIDSNENLPTFRQFEQPTIVNLKEYNSMELPKEFEIVDMFDPEPQFDDLSSKNKKTHYIELTRELSSSLPTTNDCRESIDRIYDLMNKIENSAKTNDFCNLNDIDFIDNHSTNKATSECSSLKHHSASSNPSNVSFVKPSVKNRSPRSIKPKVIISNKIELVQQENKRPKKKSHHAPAPKSVSENPLKAISQLLHDIEHVKKNKQTTSTESKIKKSEEPHKENRVRLRFNIDNKKQVDDQNRCTTDRVFRSNPSVPRGVQKVNSTPQSGRQKAILDEGRNKYTKKKIDDIIDEVKEARGEAVRGPTKFNSRLNTLAQPKKIYVQAHNQEYQSRHGRSLIADRLQRLAAAERNSKYKQKCPGQDFHPNAKPPPTCPIPPIDTSRIGRSRSTSPNEKKHLKSKDTIKNNNVTSTLTPKKPADVVSCLKPQHTTDSPPKHLQQQQIARAHHEHMKKNHSSVRFQVPSLNLEYPEKLHDVINTVISTIPMDYKKSEADIKDKNNLPLIISFNKTDSLIPEDGSGDEEDKMYNNASSQFNSSSKEDSELLRLENALHIQNYPVAFQKRLRMKNLTLTPKPSSQHVFIVHSGDGSSVVLNSKISQNFKVNSSKSDMIFPINSFSGFFTNIPLQMLTVSYALQQYPGLETLGKTEQQISTSKSSIITCAKRNDLQCILPQPFVVTKQTENKMSDLKITSHCEETVIIQCGSNENLKDETDLKCANSAFNIISEVECLNLDTCSTAVNFKETDDNMTVTTNNDVNLSTSLDILVQLLGEIKKITTCQTQMSAEQHNNKEIIDIFNKSCRNDREVAANVNIDISTSIQNDIKSFSQFNIHTEELYLRDLLKSRSYTAAVSRSKMNQSYDKALNVNLNKKEYQNKITGIPSQLVLLNVSRSTSVSNTLLGLWSKPSTLSQISVSDYHSVCAVASIDSEKKLDSATFSYKESDKERSASVEFDEQTQLISKSCTIGYKRKCAGQKRKHTRDQNFCKKVENNNLKDLNLDNGMKFKRDALVTLYSIIVLTVFAAFSLPQVI